MSTKDAEFFAEIALDLQAEPDSEQTLQAIVDYARTSAVCDDAGLFIVERGKIVTSAATHPKVARAHDLQKELGEGPCLSSLESGLNYVIDDTESEDRWPLWAKAVLELGIRSALSVQLYTREKPIGSLNLFSNEPGCFDRTDEAVTTIFASHASVALANAVEEEGLSNAVDSRHLIGLAQGILMERFDLTAERAFAVLRRYSQTRNVKLNWVAQTVVDERKLP
ncbi:GAF and ANTAR domain-containing protein [Lysinibacter cavernae]|uniref:GAF domain-containing protein n=1 Tax=Lysinibacter cavernae TaxID=1640652 RepID=A0A7X5R293_9MICO|nr:GAF and ANTAR domain-containing protein [Lysinibacter cavernae]NIH54348.1 GAF domain-containing protein [Lysinibacter cavernae]